MEWLIALTVFFVGIGLVALTVRSKKGSLPGGGAIGAFGAGLEEAFDRRGALIAQENEKRLEMEGEEESGDPPSDD